MEEERVYLKRVLGVLSNAPDECSVIVFKKEFVFILSRGKRDGKRKDPIELKSGFRMMGVLSF